VGEAFIDFRPLAAARKVYIPGNLAESGLLHLWIVLHVPCGEACAAVEHTNLLLLFA